MKQKTSSKGLFLRLSKRKAILAKIGLSLIVVIIGLAIFLVTFSAVYAQKVLPKVRVGDLNLGGMDKNDLKTALSGGIQSSNNQTLILYYADKKWEIKTGDLNLQYDRDKSINNVWDIGHSSSSWRNWRCLIVSLFAPQRAKMSYKIDSSVLDKKINKVQTEINREAKDASLQVQEEEVVVVPEIIGLELDGKGLNKKIDYALASFDFKAIETPVKKTNPRIDSQTALKAKEKFRQITAYPITVKSSDKEFQISKEEISHWLDFKAVAVLGENTQDKNKDGHLIYSLDVQISEAKIGDYLKNLATQIDVNAKDAKLGAQNGKVVVVENSLAGKALDQEKAKKLILEQLKRESARYLNLPISVKEAAVREDNIAELGIVEKIGEGTTSFGGSPSNRIHNIGIGVETISGALIKPGETFSTISRLGKIDASTGYLPELVIKDNKTIPEYGGGLCQVSTTLFRTILNAGLPVEERQNHSYRVSYYEPPIGLDATVYSPKPDLKFKNDTSGYILIQGFTSGSKITFQFFGTSDGRTTKIDGPTVYNYVSPPDTVYEETTDLAPGEAVQVEKAHTGATAKAVYHVYRGGKEINKQEFISVYKALPAVYRRGKEPESTEAPAPAPTAETPVTVVPIPAPVETPPTQ